MLRYLLRRVLYALPILVLVNLLTFLLFFVVNSPDDMARMHLGDRYVTQAAIDKWKQDRGYNRPLLYASDRDGVDRLTDTIFFEKSVRLFAFDFGRADDGRDIGADIRTRMGPSLAIAVPVLLVGLALSITAALLMALLRATYVDYAGVFLAVTLMSISALFYIIAGQYLMGKLLKLTPISGYGEGFNTLKFLILPVAVSVIGQSGSTIRRYRTLFLEEVNRDYVRTARAKGANDTRVMFRHVLRNAMIPILTGVVVIIPLLFIGSLVIESFFGIPGLGSYTIDAIRAQDFSIVRAMVFLGAVLYIIGLLLTDLSYTLVDPRVRLG